LLNIGHFKPQLPHTCITGSNYGLKHKSTTEKNPQGNSILETIHQVVANMLRSFDLDNQELDEHDPFGEYLALVAWTILCTYHTMLEAMPGQLVYRRDMILDIPYTTSWGKINSRKQELIAKSNERENNKRFNFSHVVGDKVFSLTDNHWASFWKNTKK
jgi:hypothetical protein